MSEHAPASSTPAVPLGSLLSHPDLGLRQIAGPRGEETGGTWIRWVHTSEMDDPVPYLLGGELLLTAGVHFPHFPAAGGLDAYLDRYVARAVEAGAAALGFGIAPVHDTVPDALAAACDRYGLPLLEVPPQTPFVAVGRAVWQAIAEARHRELRRTSAAQQGLATAAARPDPVPAVLRQLAQVLDAWVVLLDGQGRELHAAGTRPRDPGPRELASLAALLRGGRALATATAHHGEWHLTAHALGATGLVLGLASRRQDAVDRSVAGVAAVLLSLLTGPRHSLGGDAGTAAALVRMLLGARPEDVAPLLAPRQPGTDGGSRGEAAAERRWLVVHGRRRSRKAGGTARDAARGPAHDPDPALAAAALGVALGTPFVDVEGDGMRALLPADAPVAEQPGWTLGVSGPAGAARLADADAQAERALRRALAGRRALVRQRARDGGISSLVSAPEAAALARGTLAPLADSPALIETLRTWLSLHGSWDRTAVALDVHRNTVRQRISRIGALLGTDLGDPDARMELWFALRWLQ